MTTTFESLGVSAPLAAALAERGITEPFAIQTLTIADALAGRDVCGKAKTGSGKTLAFGLPALQTLTKAKPGHPTGIVLVPTRELATQVRDELVPLATAIDRVVTAIYGGDRIDRQIEALEAGVDPGFEIADETEMEHFLEHVLTPEENLRLDLGMPLADLVDDLARRHPTSSSGSRFR